MRRLAFQAVELTTYYSRRNLSINFRSRSFSSFSEKDELALEKDAERKIGWLLKLFFAGTATAVAYQFLPYMGDNLMQQSVQLLHVKDPWFKRMGASRLARFAIDDERRMKIVEMGGAQELINMLGAAKDDRTRKEALKALSAISLSGFNHGDARVDVNREVSLLQKPQLKLYIMLEQSQLSTQLQIP